VYRVRFVICSGVSEPTSGSVSIFGVEAAERARSGGGGSSGVGVCTSESFAWKDLTVQEHMLTIGMIQGLNGPTLTTAVSQACFEVRGNAFSWRYVSD
jgi:ABC-type Na+ transport system ATPase subunit NatA